MNYCANNTLIHYTTKFPKITDLDGTWEIGLAEIQYPHSIWSCYRMGTIPRPKGFPIEGKRHMKELKNKFDIGFQTTAQQGRPQGTVLRFNRQVVNADYDNRVQDEYLTQKYDLRTWSLLSTSHPRRYTVCVTRCHSQY
jgi:hypothetical protein